MIMAWTQEKVNEIYFKIQKLAATDEEFRAELLKDSNAAIAKIAGEELPEGMKFNVIENDPAYNATFVLPDMVGEELEDEELDSVAGGIVSFVVIVSACAAAINPGVCGADACAAKANIK
jgi:hypothetical protein